MNAFSISLYNLELDNQAGFHSFGRRWYQSNYGRFVSPDPVNGDPEEPLSWNRYLYCRNDPINYFDPDGKFAVVLLSAALDALAKRVVLSTAIASVTGAVSGFMDENGKSRAMNTLKGFIAGFAGGIAGGISPPSVDTPVNAIVSTTVYSALQDKPIFNKDSSDGSMDAIKKVITGEKKVTDVFSKKYLATVGVATSAGIMGDSIIGVKDEPLGNFAGATISTALSILGDTAIDSVYNLIEGFGYRVKKSNEVIDEKDVKTN